MNNPYEFEYCERHDTAFESNESCEDCRGEYEDSVYDYHKDNELFREED